MRAGIMVIRSDVGHIEIRSVESVLFSVNSLDFSPVNRAECFDAVLHFQTFFGTDLTRISDTSVR